MQTPSFIPSQEILEKYAKVIINFALNSGKGLKKGETVYLVGHESCKPLFMACAEAVTKSSGNLILGYLPDNSSRFGDGKTFYKNAKDAQLDFFPKNYMRGLVDDIDHLVFLIAEENKHYLDGVDSKKIMRRGKAMQQWMEWRTEKENKGKLTWTIALYGTPAMAKEARLSEEEYWQEIIQACYLDTKDPIKEWKKAFAMIEKYQKTMSKISKDTERFHMFGEDCDIWFVVGEGRKWLGGSGRNIPSFEVFTSPDWRGTEGWIRFNQPLYRYGNLIDGIRLEFKGGRVVKATASKGEKVLKEMIKAENADKVGEWSLTDKRLSRITKFMADTLYDENVGGPYGNTHIALGNSYVDSYEGPIHKMTRKQFEKLGYNYSSVHTDIMSTTNRTVVAHLKNGKEKVIYKDGEFQF
jgi:aminopeptidase